VHVFLEGLFSPVQYPDVIWLAQASMDDKVNDVLVKESFGM